MRRYSGITWDHPRGYNALAAAAAALDPAEDRLSIDWDKQPLESFESKPITTSCGRYDLVVLDHPHIGEAVAGDCLRPLEDLFDDEIIAALGEDTIGPSLASYRFAGRHWALPLDAATQVMAARADLLGEPPPDTWDEVIRLSRRSGKVAMSLAGPHALLTFLSIATALGEPPAVQDPDVLVSTETGIDAFDLMAGLACRSPANVRQENPIGLLDHMARDVDVVLCPLIFGYVNYAAPRDGTAIRFCNAPSTAKGGRPGSTLGGTGLGISTRCRVSEDLGRHLLWLMGEEAQTRFIPAHDGQPSLRAAWTHPILNLRWDDFYRNTADTLESAYVRPRHAGYVPFQGRASALLRNAIDDGVPAVAVLGKLQALYRASRANDGER